MGSKSYVITKRAASAVVAALMLLEGIINAYAVPTIPYTFTASSTAKAAEVNANFQALANGMPIYIGGVNTFPPGPGPLPATGSMTLATLTVNATITKVSPVIIFANPTIAVPAGGTISGFLDILIDGVVVGRSPLMITTATGTTWMAPVSVIGTSTITPGTHTIILAINSSSTDAANPARCDAVVLTGFIFP